MNSVILQKLNPFTPGAGMTPPELVGREDAFELIDFMCARMKMQLLDRGIIFSGLRGVGKTVLLVALRNYVAEKHVAVAQFEANGDMRTDYNLLFTCIQRAAAQVQPVAHAMSGIVKQVQSITISALGVGASVDFERESEAETNNERLDALVEQVCLLLKQHNSGLMLFIDELQEMHPKPLAALITIQHRMGQLDLPFYIIGAGLPNLPGVLSKTRSYAERLFEYRVIDRLNDSDTEQGFTEPARRLGRSFTSEAVHELVSVSQGYPYFIQAYGKAAWNASTSTPINLQAVLDAEPEARAELDAGLYQSRWQRPSPDGRAYMTAMAQLGGDMPVLSGQVAAALNKTSQEATPIRARLIELGLIYTPARGKIAFTIPSMGEYINRTHPTPNQTYDRQ